VLIYQTPRNSPRAAFQTSSGPLDVLGQKFFWVGHFLLAMTSIRMQGMLSACMLDGGRRKEDRLLL
jgi:hypothetical protein